MWDRLSSLGRIAMHNVELKLLSLVLAVICWAAIHGTISNVRELHEVPIVLNLEEGQAVRYQSVDALDVTVRGSRNAVLTLDRDSLSALVDVAKRGLSSAGTIVVRTRDISGARDVRVIDVEPSVIKLELTKEDEKRVPVKVMVIGEPDGAIVRRIASDPEEVVIRGPVVELEDVEEVETELIDIRGRTRSLAQTVSFVEPSTRWEARFTPSQVDVTIEIEEDRLTRHWEGLHVTPLADPRVLPELQVRPDRISLSLSGRPGPLRRLRDEQIRALIDCSKVKRGVTNILPVIVHVPATLQADAEPNPAQVEVWYPNPPPPPPEDSAPEGDAVRGDAPQPRGGEGP